MARIYEFIILFLLTVLFQVLLFDNLQISNYINIYMYIVALLLLPSRTPGAVVLIAGAALGAAIDMLSGMSGINSIALIFAAFIRGGVLKLFVGHDDLSDNIIPTSSRIGVGSFMLYSSVMIIINNAIIFYLDAIYIYSISAIVPKFLISCLATIFIVFLYQLPLFSPHIKKSRRK